MTYLDLDRLGIIDPDAFRALRPYPWASLLGLLTDTGYQRLRETLPDVKRFAPEFGIARSYGQRSHDRLTLEHRDDLDIPAPWEDFIGELRGPGYRDALARLLATRAFDLRFYWHYTPAGCSVSPHCDARGKLAAHIFYFNTAEDWDPSWGGDTLILDDRERLPAASAPDFGDFDGVTAVPGVGNASLLFARGEHSWHGVRELTCPEGALRKIFMVVLDRAGAIDRLRRPLRRIRRLLGRPPFSRPAAVGVSATQAPSPRRNP